ncbi:thioesterase superfamily protein [Dictyostelium discoideum AX4]|uniref:Acyl-coenzyme A thioesterase 13 n=1 Tax=Dictyostelium discoideum TaxID=44689 RepID=C7G041_DICDI|nr:thioesterase superfamily protein [Dictyostelium discoideum AX4]EEU04077.1 thioesterase superfamily protein [Dictyostelium discoideum AX4]|eukprot:XP_002649129.1 thioesterase superfamily protein [Dictyostelium discoideum AX4]
MANMIIKSNDEKLKNQLADLLNKWTKFEGFDKQFLELCTCEKLEKGKVVMSMTVDEKYCNVLSNLHGGAIATLTDVISSIAILTTNLDAIVPSVSVEISMVYSNPAPVDRKIFIVSSVYKSGRNLAFTETTIYLDSEDSGIVIAKGSHTKFIVNKKAKL